MATSRPRKRQRSDSSSLNSSSPSHSSISLEFQKNDNSQDSVSQVPESSQVLNNEHELQPDYEVNDGHDQQSKRKRPRKHWRREGDKHINIYDAVAGRVTQSNATARSLNLAGRERAEAGGATNTIADTSAAESKPAGKSDRVMFDWFSRPLSPTTALLHEVGAPTRPEDPTVDLFGAHRWLRRQQTLRSDVYRAGIDPLLDVAGFEEDDIPPNPGNDYDSDEDDEDSSSDEDAVDDSTDDMDETGDPVASAQDASFLLDENEIIARRLERDRASKTATLPDSDLLKAIHRYASRYYSALERSQQLDQNLREEKQRKRRSAKRNAQHRTATTTDAQPSDNVDSDASLSEQALSHFLRPTHTGPRQRTARKPTAETSDFGSLDGTALLALGILMEEACHALVEKNVHGHPGGESWRVFLGQDGEIASDI